MFSKYEVIDGGKIWGVQAINKYDNKDQYRILKLISCIKNIGSLIQILLKPKEKAINTMWCQKLSISIL